MRKALNTFIPVLLLIIIGCRQPKPSVLGVEFGSSFNKTWRILSEWFEPEQMAEIDSSIYIDDVTLGHFKFDNVIFSFQYDKQRSYLHKVVFFADFGDDAEKASIFEGQLTQVHKREYKGLTQYQNELGERRYKFGVNPRDENEPLGVIGRKDNSIFVIYGPIYYLPKSSDF